MSKERKAQVKRMDKKFAILIKLNADLHCQRCGTFYPILPNFKLQPGIECSHFVTRKRFNTRWIYENAYALDTGCHFYFDTHKQLYEQWLIDKQGFDQNKIDLLKLRSQKVFREDLTLIEIWIDQELKKILPKYPKLNYSFLKEFYK